MANRTPDSSRLDEAIRAFRTSRETAETLSPQTRATIVETSWNEAKSRTESGFRPAFRPARWLAGLAAASIVGVLSISILVHREAVQDRPFTVQAEKVGDEVVFTIANGNRAHSVRKATHPALLDRAEAQKIRNGRFSDSASEEAGIVFYRID